jgi:hypothetical protein
MGTIDDGDAMSEKVKAIETGELFFHATPDRERCIDGGEHDFKGWIEFDDGRGGTTVCSKCGLTAFDHSMRYGE